jgi:hypothetical protein
VSNASQISPQPHIFPTRHRDKHGKLVSFPVGAESLSRILEGVPQHALIGCHFYAGDVERRAVKPLEHVLHAVYSRQSPNVFTAKSAADSGVFDPKWSIAVFAVPSAMRHPVKLLLINEALPNIVRPWFVSQGGITGRRGQCAVVIEFDTVEGVLKHTISDKLLPDRA